MSHRPPAFWLLVLPTLAALTASAQSTAVQTAVPVKQAASAPPAVQLTYRSAFENYRPYSDDPVLPWKETNTQVKNAGGWRAYAKEAREPDASDSKTPASATKPHAGHDKP